jgi:hypothetical protein
LWAAASTTWAQVEAFARQRADALADPGGGRFDPAHRRFGPSEHGLEPQEHHRQHDRRTGQRMQHHAVDAVARLVRDQPLEAEALQDALHDLVIAARARRRGRCRAAAALVRAPP